MQFATLLLVITSEARTLAEHWGMNQAKALQVDTTFR